MTQPSSTLHQVVHWKWRLQNEIQHGLEEERQIKNNECNIWDIHIPVVKTKQRHHLSTLRKHESLRKVVKEHKVSILSHIISAAASLETRLGLFLNPNIMGHVNMCPKAQVKELKKEI